MQQGKKIFEFPQEDMRDFIRYVDSKQDLDLLLRQLKSLLLYYQNQVAYSIEENIRNQGKNSLKTLTVSFKCCDSQFQRPILHFVSQNDLSYQLQKSSLYLHKHLPKPYKNQIKFASNNNITISPLESKMNISYQTSLNVKRNIQTQDQKKLQNFIRPQNKVNQKYRLDRMEEELNRDYEVFESNKNQKQQKLKSRLLQESIQNQNQVLMKLQSFDFPLESQIKFLQEFYGIESLKRAYQQLIQQPHHKDKDIRIIFQEKKLYSAVMGSRVNIYFQCCNEQHDVAFFTYTSEDNRKYKLSKSFDLRHFHEIKDDKQEISDGKNMQKIITDEINQSLSAVIYDNSNHELFSQDKSGYNQSSIQKIDQKMVQQEPIQSQKMGEQVSQKDKKQVQIQIDEQSDSQNFLLPLSHEMKSKSLSKKQYSDQTQKLKIKKRQQPIASKRKTFQGLIQLNQFNSQRPNFNSKNDTLIQEIFQFPTQQELQTIKGKTQSSILSSVNNIIKKHHLKNYEYHFQSYESSTQVYDKVFNLKIYFYCCRGVQNKVPYLHFSRLIGGQFQLINHQNQHDHSKKQHIYERHILKEKFYQMMRQKKTQQQQLNHFQASKISGEYPYQVFFFPSNEFLYKMNRKTCKKIIQAMGIQINRMKGSKKYIKQENYISTIQGSTDHYLEFNFTCCKGFNNKQPFIRFSIQNDLEYYIVAQSRWHDHRKKPQQKRKTNQKIIKDIENKKDMKKVQSIKIPKNVLQKQNKNDTKHQQEQIKQSFLVLNNQCNQIKINGNNHIENIPIEFKTIPQQKILNQNQSHFQERSKTNTQMIEQSKENNEHKKLKENISKIPLIKQKILTKNNDLVFDFPSKQQIQKLRRCNQEDIQKILTQIIERNPNKRIKYQIQKSKIIQKNGQTRDNLTINFICCKKNIQKNPYLMFLRRQNQKQYFLGPQSKRHQHILDENQQKNLVNLQIQDKNTFTFQKTQEIKTVNKQLSSGKKYKEMEQFQQKQNLTVKTKQIQKSPKKSQLHKKYLINSNQQQSKQYEQIEQNLEERLKKNEQKKLKDIVNAEQVVINLPIRHSMIEQQNQNNKESYFQEEESNSHQKVQMSPQRQKQSILEQFQSFYQKVTQFISEKKQKKLIKTENDDEQKVKGQYRNSFPQIQINQDIQFWILKQSIFQVMQYNNLHPLQFQGDQNQNQQRRSDFEFQKVIFVRKNQNQIENKALKQLHFNNNYKEVYLAVHQISIYRSQQTLKILLAFTYNNNQQLEILWFYIYRQNLRRINISSILNNNNDPEQLFEVFKQCIKYFRLQKIKFIFTTFDYQLMKTLNKICLPNSQQHFSSLMHPCCLKKLFCNTNIMEDSPLGNEINKKIRKSQNFQQIKNSYNALNNIFNNANSQENIFKNPRKIYQNYMDYIKLFSNNHDSNLLTKTSLKQFLEKFIFPINELKIQDPVEGIDQIFTEKNQFNHIASVFILIVATFDYFNQSRPNLKQSVKKRIVPFGLYQIRKQCKIFNSIHYKSQSFPYTIEKIFAQTAYQISSIIEKCPRFITQTMYRLIIAANFLDLVNQKQNQSQNQNFKIYLYQDNQQPDKLYKVQIKEKENQKQQKNSKLSYQQNPTKKWICTCSFYKQTSLPCQHEILTALKNKDSIFKEINSTWKNA